MQNLFQRVLIFGCEVKLRWQHKFVSCFCAIKFEMKKGCSIALWFVLTVTGNTKRGSITVLLTSCLTGLESAVGQLTFFFFICKTD